MREFERKNLTSVWTSSVNEQYGARPSSKPQAAVELHPLSEKRLSKSDFEKTNMVSVHRCIELVGNRRQNSGTDKRSVTRMKSLNPLRMSHKFDQRKGTQQTRDIELNSRCRGDSARGTVAEM